MRHLLARTPPAAVIAMCILWIVGAFALPLFYAQFKGWGYYWAFSAADFLVTVPLLIGPPLLLVLIWRRSRRERPRERAV